VRDPLGDFSINAQGTLQVLEAVRKKNNKAVFIYTSTNKVYGENVDKIPLREEQTRFCFAGKIKGVNEGLSVDNTARTPYGTSKLTGDLYVQEYGYLYGLDTYCFRMSCIYGERQFGFEDQGWVAHFIFSLLKDKPVTIFGNGKQVRDLLYAQDLIRAFEAAIVKRPQSRVFNIGGGIDNTLSLLEFCDYLGKKSGNKLGLRFEPERPSDQKVYISDFSLFTRETGWQPQIGVREGIDRLYEWAADYLSSENRRHLPAGEAGNTEVR
jgi:CDP-paratose 2-epimerase